DHAFTRIQLHMKTKNKACVTLLRVARFWAGWLLWVICPLLPSALGEDDIDGINVDQLGNVYVSAPGGLWILSPQGKHLGTSHGPEHPHNLASGDAEPRIQNKAL